MKGLLGQFLRETWKPAVGAAALGMLLVGCGDKSSDPDAVSVDELKYPGNLVIKDQGNGAATLWWSGSNNEEKFDGYNVYGMKGKAADLGVEDGKPLQLLTDAGEPNTEAKTALNNFNYDPEKKLTEKGTATDAEAEFEFFPIHTKDGDTRFLPTCKVQNGTCSLTTAATAEKTAEDPNFAVNGAVKFVIPDAMVIGESYCFLVLSSMDAGSTVSQTSSNAACFEPAYKAEFTLPLPGASPTGTSSKKLDLAGWLTACNAAGTCADPTTGTTKFVDTDAGNHKSTDTMAVYVETTSSQAGPTFVAGKNSAVIDLGYYAGGFDDANLPATAPTLVLDTDTYTVSSTNSAAPIFNGGGYSIAGQSVPVEANHMYVIAVGDPAATGTLTEFTYHWLYIKGTVVGATTVDVEARLAKNAK